MNVHFHHYPCEQCRAIIHETSTHCPYCGLEANARPGLVQKLTRKVRDLTGNLHVHPRNLQALAGDIEKSQARCRKQLQDLETRFKSALTSIGLDTLLTEVRTAFARFGGGGLNELLEGRISRKTTGFDYFQARTDPSFFWAGDEALPQKLVDVEMFFDTLRTALKNLKNGSIFNPRSQFEQVLEKSLAAVRKFKSDEAKQQLAQVDAVIITLSKTRRALERKLNDLAILSHAVRIEFWKAEGKKLVFAALAENNARKSPASAFEKVVSEGKTLIESYNAELASRSLKDSLNLVDLVNRTTKTLEEAKFLSISREALSIAESISPVKLQNDSQRLLESLSDMGKGDTHLTPAFHLHATFTACEEQDIRLAAEERVTGTMPRTSEEQE